MNRIIYRKEVFLKNDLTYLTFSYFLFIASFDIDLNFLWTPFAISGICLAIGWYFQSSKKTYSTQHI